MTTTFAAENIINSQLVDYGIDTKPFQECLGYVLAEDITADRDLPPYNRITMDGVAIRFDDYASGIRMFKIIATVGAGQEPPVLDQIGTCIEIMTGGSLPMGADTIIRYEDVNIADENCILSDVELRKGQHIHLKGSDKSKGGVLVPAGSIITASHIALAAASGYALLKVKRLPQVAIFSSGDEIVDVTDHPNDFQIRQSNVFALEALLNPLKIKPKLFMLNDDEEAIRKVLDQIIQQFDVLILTGGVSKGKFDFIPKTLASLGIEKHFHSVSQRPGKPFWFGSGRNTIVFALPGNPVSTTLCAIRYVIPWFWKTIGAKVRVPQKVELGESVIFEKSLTLYLPCQLEHEVDGKSRAFPIPTNGSGDFASLTEADGFIEIPIKVPSLDKGSTVDFYPI